MFATHKFTCTVNDAISIAVRDSLDENEVYETIYKPEIFYEACTHATERQATEVNTHKSALKNLLAIGEKIARETAGDIGSALYEEHISHLRQELG